MKTRLILIALLLMSIISTQYAYADGRDDHRRCAIVGVWNGDLAIGGEGAPGIPISIAFHFGGTGTGMDINDVGGGEGSGGTVQNYAWKKIKGNRYRVLMSNIIRDAGLPEIGGGYRLAIDVTGKLSDDCQVLSLTGTFSAYSLADRTLINPFPLDESGTVFELPTSFELERVDLLRD